MSAAAGIAVEARSLLSTLAAYDGRPLTFMEVCGTHTMAIAKAGLRDLLAENIRLISGPGCPVCVTPVGTIDHALTLAALPGVVLTTFGDLMRVPGSTAPGIPAAPACLQRARAAGGDVRVVYSPLDALQVAREEPSREVVFLGVGFETTAPTVAGAILFAQEEGLGNFSVLAAHKTIPEAMGALAAAADLDLDGFLCPGHVSVILGTEPYAPLAHRHGLACAIAGFEPVEILRGLVSLVAQVVAGRPTVDNRYGGPVKPAGNPRARKIMSQVFEPCDSTWRGLGTIPHSGLRIREAFAHYDAARRIAVDLPDPVEPPGCRCGDVLRGVLSPAACPLFGGLCSPATPQGACMVSSEGSCAAHYHYAKGDWQ